MKSTRKQLLSLLKLRSFKNQETTLASGKISNFFIDCKQSILSAKGHFLAAKVILKTLRTLPAVDAIAAVELGGCPIASAVATLSYMKGYPIDALYIRKSLKEHGSNRMIEGNDTLKKGSNVILLEDVTTTGNSAQNAVDTLKNAGYNVPCVISLVDRLEGAKENLENYGISLVSIFTIMDFINHDD